MVRTMGKLWAIWLTALAVMVGTATLAPPPVSAQDTAIPRTYPERSSNRASPDKPADEVARETAAADAAEAACAAGSQVGCSALGWAYHRGEGRPQNRPVAELIYRKACAAAEASACYRLSELLRALNSADPDQLAADSREIVLLLVRACRLGSLEGCDAQADDLAWGILGDADPVAAEALRRSTCAAGWPQSCRTLADLLLGDDRSAAERDEGRALLDRQCRAGDTRACSDAERHWRAFEGQASDQAQAYEALGCDAGDGWACTSIAMATLRGDPPDRAAALALLDRACPTTGTACTYAAVLREEPVLAADCERGAQAACIRLGTLMAEQNGPIENRPRALDLLGAACDAGAFSACAEAGSLIFDRWRATGAAQPERADAYLSRGCANGAQSACERLADALAEGIMLTQDTQRAAELYVGQCEAGRSSACRFVAELAANDPSTPLLLAANYLPPERTPEEIAAAEQAEREAEAREKAEDRARRCTTTVVIYEGVAYTDTLCDNLLRVIGGFDVPRIAQAPWQAMIWRPAVLGGKPVADPYRVACGGTVVATGWILTAAHCLVDHIDKEGRLKYAIDKTGYRIRLGVIQPLTNEGNSYPITRVIPHPLFNRESLAFDIALIQYDPKAGSRGENLFTPARIRLDTRTMAERPVAPKAAVFTFGWGRTDINRAEAAKVLQGVRLELEDPQTCTRVTGFSKAPRKDSALCAKGRNRAQACFGDSGGPLITYGDQQGIPTLIGVVSGGRACGTRDIASQYTRIGHPEVRAWLALHLPGFKLASGGR